MIDIEMYSFTWNARTYRHDEIWAAANEYSFCDQPSFWTSLDWILDTPDPSAIADEVVEAVKTVYGDVILWYINEDDAFTIMDDLAEDTYGIRTEQGHVIAWFLLRAFTKAGFKYGRECSEEEIERVRMRQEWSGRFQTYSSYQKVIGDTEITIYGYSFDHQCMCKTHDQRQLRDELVQYIHQPRFIQKWVEAGNNAEDYLG
jgi:hypothetical protein